VQALETLVGAQDKMLSGLMKINDAQARLIGEYRQLAALAQDRADRAEAKAERLEKWAVYGTVGGLVLGLIGGALTVLCSLTAWHASGSCVPAASGNCPEFPSVGRVARSARELKNDLSISGCTHPLVRSLLPAQSHVQPSLSSA